MKPRKSSSWIILLFALPLFAQDGQQKFATLGDFKLISGEVIRDCRIGYRTFGRLNTEKSNVILFPTWSMGTTEQLQGNVGPAKLADSSKYFVVLMDALANGISSSPSNSSLQPRMKFPRITHPRHGERRIPCPHPRRWGFITSKPSWESPWEECKPSSGSSPIPTSWTKPSPSPARPASARTTWFFGNRKSTPSEKIRSG